MHPPIRLHIQRAHPPLEGDRDRAVQVYLEYMSTLAKKVGWPGGHDATEALRGRTSNIETMIEIGLQSPMVEATVSAAVDFTRFLRFSGLGRIATIEGAANVAKEIDVGIRGDALHALGSLYFARSNFSAARTALTKALDLYREMGEAQGE